MLGCPGLRSQSNGAKLIKQSSTPMAMPAHSGIRWEEKGGAIMTMAVIMAGRLWEDSSATDSQKSLIE